MFFATYILVPGVSSYLRWWSASVNGIVLQINEMECPSSHLRSILSAFSDDTATHLSIALSKHIYPVLDTLPDVQAQAILVALQAVQQEVQNTQNLVSKIDLAARKQAFESDLRAAPEHSRDMAFWTEMGRRYTEGIRNWMPLLWQVGVEKGLNRGLVRECLSFCEEVDRRLVPPQALAKEWSVAISGFLTLGSNCS